MKKENNLSIMIISSWPLSKMIQSFNKQLSQKKFYNENDLIFSKLHIKTKNLTEEEIEFWNIGFI